MLPFDLEFVEILGLGVIGLAFLLAVLAYLLLMEEQKKTEPSDKFIKATYVYMAFCLALTIIGLASVPINMFFDSKIKDFQHYAQFLPKEIKGNDITETKTKADDLVATHNKLKERLNLLQSQSEDKKEELLAIKEELFAIIDALKKAYKEQLSFRNKEHSEIHNFEFFLLASIVDDHIWYFNKSIMPKYTTDHRKIKANKDIWDILYRIGFVNKNENPTPNDTLKAIQAYQKSKNRKRQDYITRIELALIVQDFLIQPGFLPDAYEAAGPNKAADFTER